MSETTEVVEFHNKGLAWTLALFVKPDQVMWQVWNSGGSVVEEDSATWGELALRYVYGNYADTGWRRWRWMDAHAGEFVRGRWADMAREGRQS